LPPFVAFEKIATRAQLCAQINLAFALISRIGCSQGRCKYWREDDAGRRDEQRALESWSESDRFLSERV